MGVVSGCARSGVVVVREVGAGVVGWLTGDMAVYPIRKRRAGRAWLVAVVMILLALAAGVLFSAGSDHHRHGYQAGPGDRVAVVSQACLPQEHTGEAGHVHPDGEMPAHGHEHGNEWTPNLAPRLRLGGDAALVSTVVRHVSPLCPGLWATHLIGAVRDPDLLGVLRV